MKPFPGERTPSTDDLAEVLAPTIRPETAVALAQTCTLQIALRMLQAQIASRRAIIAQDGMTVEEVDRVSREVQRRLDRIRLVAAELRRRGVEVEWEE